MGELRLRRATALDNELLARLGAETFPGNFVGGSEPSGMGDYIATRFTPEVLAEQLKERGSTFFIAYSGSDPVGYSRVREGPVPPDVTARPAAEVHRMYVAEAHWGQGLGKALIEACIEEASNRGCAVVWLAAWSENPRALGFYRSLGFVEVGTQVFELGDDRHLDLVMQRPLGAAASR